MELLATAVLICGTAIYLFRQHGPPQLNIYISPKPEPTPDSEAAEIPVPPVEILLFCSRESEAYAREAMLQRAHRLYQQYKNWDTVMKALQSYDAD